MSAAKLSSRTPESPILTVLVVEDDPILRYGLALEVREAGYHVREAANADEAEALLQTGTPVHLVITDIQMPGPRDGLALAKTVRAFRPQTKVIVASGIMPKTGIVGVADAFFGKPYDMRQVILRIHSLLGEPDLRRFDRG